MLRAIDSLIGSGDSARGSGSGSGSVTVITGWWIFIIPRLCMFLYSILFDYCLSRICSALRRSSVPVLLVSSTSWCVLVLLQRTFSNGGELLWLTILMAFVICDRPSAAVPAAAVSKPEQIQSPELSLSADRRPFWFGLVLACGVFTRASFPVFAFPIGLYLWYDQWQLYGRSRSGGEWQRPAYVILVRTPILIVVSFLFASALIVIGDSLYFQTLVLPFGGTAGIPLSVSGVMKQLVITPWNFLVYNSNPDNLAAHGLHPRYTHSTLNSLIMFSVLYGVWIAKLITSFYTAFAVCCRRRRRRGTALDPATRSDESPSSVHVMCMCDGVLVVGLLALSIAPHQEPRFLLPLLTPLVLRHATTIYDHWFGWRLWIVVNAVLLVLFGACHQSGIVPALIDCSHALNQPMAVTAIGTDSYPLQLPLLLSQPLTLPPAASSDWSAAAAALIAAGGPTGFSSLDLIFYHCYMPPRSLLAFERSRSRSASVVDGDCSIAVGTARSLCTYDAGGGDSDSLMPVLHRALSHRLNSSAAADGVQAMAIITPATISDSVRSALANRDFCYDKQFRGIEFSPPRDSNAARCVPLALTLCVM